MLVLSLGLAALPLILDRFLEGVETSTTVSSSRTEVWSIFGCLLLSSASRFARTLQIFRSFKSHVASEQCHTEGKLSSMYTRNLSGTENLFLQSTHERYFLRPAAEASTLSEAAAAAAADTARVRLAPARGADEDDEEGGVVSLCALADGGARFIFATALGCAGRDKARLESASPGACSHRLPPSYCN